MGEGDTANALTQYCSLARPVTVLPPLLRRTRRAAGFDCGVRLMNAVRTAKETVRHLLFRVGIKRRSPHLEHTELKDRFAQIYKDGVWVAHHDDVPLSGAGSTIEATAHLREQLPRILADLEAKVLLDVGCGDFNWMRTVELPCDYVGVDIVPAVIERNKSLYESTTRSFKVADIVASPAPSADVVICREVLFHLSFEHGRSLL